MKTAEVLASVDIIALRLGAGQQLEVLLLKRAQAPFAGEWALPGVLVNGRSADASLDAAANRALAEKAQLQPVHLEQVATQGNASRDPRGWSLSSFYLALVPPDTPVQDPELCFVPLSSILAGEQALPFDHNDLVRQVSERLAAKSMYTSLPLLLLPPRFTVTDALLVFQACLGQPVQHTTLRGRLERLKERGLILDTGLTQRPPMGRPQKVLERRPGVDAVHIFDRSVLS
jgi:8-oxo-dGTP diphosphatase